MKKWSVLLVAVLVLAATTMVPAAQAMEVSGDAYVGYYDKYLWRGFDLSGGTAVVQGGVDLSAKGFTLSYWTNIQTQDDVILGSEVNGGNATETDMTLDYSFDINDLLSASVGTIWYALDGLEDTKEAYLGLSLNTLLDPSVTVYYDYDQAEGNALFYTASIGHSLDLSKGLRLNLGALVSYNDESDYAVGDYTAWHNYELSAGLDYALNDNVTISPSFVYSSPISDEAKDSIDTEFLTGVSIAYNF